MFIAFRHTHTAVHYFIYHQMCISFIYKLYKVLYDNNFYSGAINVMAKGNRQNKFRKILNYGYCFCFNLPLFCTQMFMILCEIPS